MFLRRVLALITALCLLIALMAVPGGPVLVCRITGTPMAPVAVSETRFEDSCCTVTVSGGSPETPRFALTAPGCCELRQDPGAPTAPAVTADSPEISTVALLPAPPFLRFPVLQAVVVHTQTLRESAPRAPPSRCSSPRAPPVFA